VAAPPELKVPVGQGDSSVEPGAGTKYPGSAGVHEIEALSKYKNSKTEHLNYWKNRRTTLVCANRALYRLLLIIFKVVCTANIPRYRMLRQSRPQTSREGMSLVRPSRSQDIRNLRDRWHRWLQNHHCMFPVSKGTRWYCPERERRIPDPWVCKSWHRCLLQIERATSVP
jgi:hypothetical protein